MSGRGWFYVSDGLQIAYVENRRRDEVLRADPRIVLTHAELVMFEYHKVGVVVRHEHTDPWWRGCTFETRAAAGIGDGRVVYRFVDRAVDRDGWLLAWPD